MRGFVLSPRAGWAVALLVIAWLGVHFVAASTVPDSVFDGGLVGTDSYMRLVRVDELVAGGGWFDHVIARSNAPFGDELHWTRPFDLLLLALAAPLSPALGFEDALFVAGGAVSPLLHLGMIGVLVWAIVPLVGLGRAPMAAIVLLVQPAVIGHSLAGQADHHALQLLVLALAIGLLLRLFQDASRSRVAWAAGAVAGLGIWVSAEMTILAGLVTALLVVAWLRDPTARIGALARYGAGLGMTVLLALLVERPPADWFAVEYDKISVAHLAAAAAVLGVAAVLWLSRPIAASPRRRVASAGVAAVLVGAPLLLFFGGLIVGPGADVNPAIGPIWLDYVSELQPLFPTDGETAGTFLLYLGPVLVGLPVAAVAVWRNRDDDGAMLAWVSVVAFLGTYTVLSLLHLRFASFAGVLIAVVSAEVLGEMRDWLRRVPASMWRRAAWIGATLGLSVGFTISGGAVAAANSDTGLEETLGCPRAAYNLLASAGAPADVTFAHINVGPEILYRTELAIVAGPYHRNDRGILDLHTFFAATDSEVSRQIAAERDGRFALVCTGSEDGNLYAGSSDAPSLHDRLVEGAPPPWLTLVAGGDREGEGFFRLYEMEPLP